MSVVFGRTYPPFQGGREEDLSEFGIATRAALAKALGRYAAPDEASPIQPIIARPFQPETFPQGASGPQSMIPQRALQYPQDTPRLASPGLGLASGLDALGRGLTGALQGFKHRGDQAALSDALGKRPLPSFPPLFGAGAGPAPGMEPAPGLLQSLYGDPNKSITPQQSTDWAQDFGQDYPTPALEHSEPASGDRGARVYSLLSGLGWSPGASHAMLATLGGESGRELNTGIYQGKGGFGRAGTSWDRLGTIKASETAAGIANWNGPRAERLKAWAESNGLNPGALETQVSYVHKEALEMGLPIGSTADPATLTKLFTGTFERPAVNNGAARWANYSGHGGRRVELAGPVPTPDTGSAPPTFGIGGAVEEDDTPQRHEYLRQDFDSSRQAYSEALRRAAAARDAGHDEAAQVYDRQAAEAYQRMEWDSRQDYGLHPKVFSPPATVAPGTGVYNPRTGGYEVPIPKEQPAAPPVARPITPEERKAWGLPATGQYSIEPGGAPKLIPGTSPADERPPTEAQANAGIYADRMRAADRIISQPGMVQHGTSLLERAGSEIPVLGNYLISPQLQQLNQAQRDFVNAVLRKESGAAISQSEFDSANKQYFPAPGDGPEVIARKAENRKTALDAISRAAGPGYKPRSEPSTAAPSRAPGPPRITGGDDYNALPSGARYTAPDGTVRTKR